MKANAPAFSNSAPNMQPNWPGSDAEIAKLHQTLPLIEKQLEAHEGIGGQGLFLQNTPARI